MARTMTIVRQARKRVPLAAPPPPPARLPGDSYDGVYLTVRPWATTHTEVFQVNGPAMNLRARTTLQRQLNDWWRAAATANRLLEKLLKVDWAAPSFHRITEHARGATYEGSSDEDPVHEPAASDIEAENSAQQ